VAFRIGLYILLAALIVLVPVRLRWANEKRFQRIQPGMSQQEVFAIMGAPRYGTAEYAWYWYSGSKVYIVWIGNDGTVATKWDGPATAEPCDSCFRRLLELFVPQARE
jgi:hypothetical protein